MPRIRTLGCLVAAVLLCWPAAAHAAPDYTGKTLRLIVGTSPGDTEAFNAWMAQYRFFRPFAAPPKAPAEAVEVLRKAFRATLEDPEFLALAKKTRMTIDYVSAEDVAAQVKQALAVSPAVKAKLRNIIGN